MSRIWLFLFVVGVTVSLSAQHIVITPSRTDLVNPTFDGVVTGEPTFERAYFREDFLAPHLVLEEDFTAKVVSDAGINVVLFSPGGIVEFREELLKTASSWVQADGVLDISADNTINDEGVEIYLGDDDDQTGGWIVAQTTGACFTVRFTITLIAGTDQFLIGWRQNEAFQDVNAYEGYSDWAVVGINNTDGSIFALAEVAGGGTLSDDSAVNAADADVRIFRSCIGADGVPTAQYSGDNDTVLTNITLTNGATAKTSGVQMSPFITYMQAGGVTDSGITIDFWQIEGLP